MAFLTLNYVKKILNEYGFHSFIKHVLKKKMCPTMFHKILMENVTV